MARVRFDRLVVESRLKEKHLADESGTNPYANLVREIWDERRREKRAEDKFQKSVDQALSQLYWFDMTL